MSQLRFRAIAFVCLKSVLFAVPMLALGVTPAHALTCPTPNNTTCTLTTSFITNGSPSLLYNPEVQLIFWGSHWSDGTSPTVGQVVGGVQDIVNGAYMTPLSQYGIQRARMASFVAIDTSSSPPSGFDGLSLPSNDITAEINRQIQAGTIPEPNLLYDTLYTVIIPPNIPPQAQGVGGAHQVGSYSGVKYYYAWARPFDQTAASITQNLSHELVEAATDPDGSSGFNALGSDNSTPKPLSCSCEIADVCGGDVQANGVGTYGYWSVNDQKCVNPRGWNGIFEYTDYRTNWASIDPGVTVHQLYAGGWGLVAADFGPPNQVSKYTGSGAPGAWTPIGFGPQGSNIEPGVLAVTDSGLYGLALDSSAVYAYDSGTNWIQIGGPALTIVGGGSTLIGISPDGSKIYQYQGNGSWTKVGTAGNQFVVNNQGMFGLTPGHDAIMWRPPTSSKWSQIGGPADQIFGGPGLLGQLDTYREPQVWTGPLGGWFVQGVAVQGAMGNMFGITGSSSSPSLNELAGDLQHVYRSTNTSANNPSWNRIGFGTSYIVGGGPKLWAVNGVQLNGFQL